MRRLKRSTSETCDHGRRCLISAAASLVLSPQRQLNRSVPQRFSQLDDRRFEQWHLGCGAGNHPLGCENAIVQDDATRKTAIRMVQLSCRVTSAINISRNTSPHRYQPPTTSHILHGGEPVRHALLRCLGPHDATAAHHHIPDNDRLKKDVLCPHVCAVLRNSSSE
jgi:hypothetical protein